MGPYTEKVNITIGGRVLTTLLFEMKRRGAKKGVAALCLGGGNSVAMAVERD